MEFNYEGNVLVLGNEGEPNAHQFLEEWLVSLAAIPHLTSNTVIRYFEGLDYVVKNETEISFIKTNATNIASAINNINASILSRASRTVAGA